MLPATTAPDREGLAHPGTPAIGQPAHPPPPYFQQLIDRPAPEEAHVWVLAPLESARVTGAYAFRIEPGSAAQRDTLIEVTARVLPRAHAGTIDVLGLAPLTSMYVFGEDQPARFGDYRPEVHDPDGMVAASWRAHLSRPPQPAAHDDQHPSGSTRRVASGSCSAIATSRATKTSSRTTKIARGIWIEPLGDWGKGALRLLEIATELETDDNIALLWVPEGGVSVAYRMHVGYVDQRDVSGSVVATRRTRTPAGNERFLIDFAIDEHGYDLPSVKVVASATGGTVSAQRVEAVPGQDVVRASFEVTAERQARDIERRAFLQGGEDVVTEAWSYLWQPAPAAVTGARNHSPANGVVEAPRRCEDARRPRGPWRPPR